MLKDHVGSVGNACRGTSREAKAVEAHDGVGLNHPEWLQLRAQIPQNHFL